MGFVKKRFFVSQKIKTFLFLMQELKINQAQAQRMIDKGHVLIDGNVLTDKSSSIQGEVEITIFEPINLNNIEVIFENSDFAIFNKPNEILTHPRKRDNTPSILDVAKARYGKEANIIHRLDAQTSGLIIISKHKIAEKNLKKLFEQREVKKSYKAIIKGLFYGKVTIDAPILQNKNFSDIKMKVLIDSSGKEAKTIFKSIKRFNKHTLIEAIPITGRQHQIRAHAYFMGYPILGEHIYGVPKQITAAYLDNKLSNQEKIELFGAPRLCLHSYYLSFYYQGKFYEFIKEPSWDEIDVDLL